MLQERFADVELENKLLDLLQSAFKEGEEKGFVDNNPIFDHALGGFAALQSKY